MSRKRLYNSGIVYSTDPDLRISTEEEQESITLPEKEQSLIVRIDSKQRGGKVVTLVEGFLGTLPNMEILGKQLKSYCGTGGSVKNNEIIIQGDKREKILQWLKRNGYVKAVIK